MTDNELFQDPPAGGAPKLEKGLVLTLAKGTGVSLVGRTLGRAFLLLGQAIMARSLGVDAYGLFSLGWSVLQISLYAGPVGLPQGVVHFGSQAWKADEERFKRVLQQTVFLAVVMGLVSGTVLFLFSSQAAALFGKPGLEVVLRGTAIALALTVVLKVVAAITRISQRMQFSVIVEDLLPSVLIAAGALIFVTILRAGLSGSLIAVIAAYLSSTVLAFLFVYRLYPGFYGRVRWQGSLFREIAAFSAPASLAGILVILIQWITRLILGYLRPEGDVGVYQAASQLASLPAIILASTGAVFTPMIARLAGEGRNRQLDELYKIATKWTVYVSLPLFLVMVFFPASFLELVFGRAYGIGALPLVVMAVGQLVNMGTGSVAPLHIMLGHQKSWVIILIASLAVTVALNWWWIPEWGVVGAAVGNSIGISIANLAGLLNIRMRTGLWPYDRRYWKGMAAALAPLPILVGLAYLFPSGMVSLIVATLASAGLFFLALWKMGFDDEDRSFWAAMRRRLGV